MRVGEAGVGKRDANLAGGESGRPARLVRPAPTAIHQAALSRLTALVQPRVLLRDSGCSEHHVAAGARAHGDTLPANHRGLVLGCLKLEVQRLGGRT